MGKKFGTVKIFFKNKGYGFIHSERKDIFFRVNDIFGPELPRNGARVGFVEKYGKKGPFAVEIDILDGGLVICENCKNIMFPRTVFYLGGNPDKSVCRFCGAVFKVFPKTIYDEEAKYMAVFFVLAIIFSVFCFFSTY